MSSPHSTTPGHHGETASRAPVPYTAASTATFAVGTVTLLLGVVLTLGTLVPVLAGAVVMFTGAALVTGAGLASTLHGMRLARAAQDGDRMAQLCGAVHHGDGLTCHRTAGHDGPHRDERTVTAFADTTDEPHCDYTRDAAGRPVPIDPAF